MILGLTNIEFLIWISVTGAVAVPLIAFFIWFTRRKKIRIRVKTAVGEKHYLKNVDSSGHTIIMRPGKAKDGGWAFNFTVEDLLFKGSRKILDVFPDALNAVTWHNKTKTVDMPVFDKKASKKFIEAEALKQRGHAPKMQISLIFYIMVILQIIVLVVVVMAMKGVTF